MKKKVLAITLATVLALSLGLVLAAPVGADPGELVTNGSFETPDTSVWGVYTSVSGWTIEWRDGDPGDLGGYTRPSPQLEIHDATGIGWGTAAADGNQWAELDADWYEPPYGVVDNTTVEPSSTKISQDLSTVADDAYLLSFAFSARSDVANIDSRIGVYWDGTQVFDINKTGQPFGWTYYNAALTASDSSTTLEFRDLGISDGYGTLLDDVSVVPISIEIAKEADREYAYEGHTINYLYRVHNDGDIPLGPVVVTDSLPITPTPVLVPPRPGFNIGDLNQNGVLDPCEEWQFTASYTVPDPCARTVIPNTGTAIAGTGYEPVTRVSAESNEVRVIILHPCIEIDKWTDEYAYFNGTEITYYYKVHNCGDTPLELHRVTDTTLEQDANPILGRDRHNRGDLNGNGILDPCEWWYFSLDHTLECDTITYSDSCNTAVAAAFEPILDSRFFDETMWKVRIFQWLPRSKGYWGNWDNHWSENDMATLVRYVNFQSDYFGYPGDNEGWDLTYDEVHDLLLEKMKGKMDTDKAEKMLRKQLLAAWLSVKSYEGATDTNDDTPGSLEAAMNPNATVYINGAADGTVEELLHRIENAIGSLDVDGLLLAKDILEKMNTAESNNYEMFLDPDFDPTASCP